MLMTRPGQERAATPGDLPPGVSVAGIRTCSRRLRRSPPRRLRPARSTPGTGGTSSWNTSVWMSRAPPWGPPTIQSARRHSDLQRAPPIRGRDLDARAMYAGSHDPRRSVPSAAAALQRLGELGDREPPGLPDLDLGRQRDLLGVGDDVEQRRSGMGERSPHGVVERRRDRSTRTACRPTARATAAKSRLPSTVPNSGRPPCSCSSLTMPSRPLSKTISLTGRSWATAVMQVAEQHRQPAVAAERDHLAVAVERLGAERLRHGVGHRAEVVGAEQPTGAAHRHEPRQPHRRHPGVGGEDRVVRRRAGRSPRRAPRAGCARRGCRTSSAPSRRSRASRSRGRRAAAARSRHLA